MTHDEWMRVRRERDDLLARVERLEAERDALRAEMSEYFAEAARLREALRGLVESVEYENAPPLSGALKQARAALNHQGGTQ